MLPGSYRIPMWTWRLTEEVIGDRSVDLIEIEMAGESLRRAIQRYGVEL
jgi:hypothetical protein